MVPREIIALSGYQPTGLGVGSLLSNGLFGDGIAGAVVPDALRRHHR